MRGGGLLTRPVVLVILMLTTVAAVVSGCSGREGVETSSGGDGVTVTNVAIVTPEKANDFGWNQQGVEGAVAAAAAAGAGCIVQDGAGYGDITPILKQLAAREPQLIYTWASGYNTVAPQVARETGIATVIIGAGDQANVPGLVNDLETNAQHGAYLAGILAARMSASGTVAIVVSAEDENWTKMSGGFIAGVRDTDSAVEILYVQIGQAGYADAAGGKRVTQSAIAGGADVIFGMGDGSSFGMLQAVETSKPPEGADEIWFIDVIGDKSSLDEEGVYLSSVVWDFTELDGTAMAQVEDGSFGSATYYLGLDNGITLLQTEWIPDEVWAEIEAARQGITEGAIEVPLTRTERDVQALLKSGG